MYALKLTNIAETQLFPVQQISCGMSRDGQVLATFSHQQNENYGFYVYDFYLRIYMIGEKQIHSQRFQISSGQFSYPSLCYVNHREQQTIKIYLIFITADAKDNAIIVQINKQLTDTQPKVTHKEFNQKILGSQLDQSADEIYLLFRNHIQGLQRSQKIVHNQDIQTYEHIYGMAPFIVMKDSGYPTFIFLKEERQKLNAVSVDRDGRLNQKFIIDLPKNSPTNDSAISYDFKVSADHGLIYVGTYDYSNYENPHKDQIFIGPGLNILELDASENRKYRVLKFGDLYPHLLVLREHYSCPESYCIQICYWKYHIQGSKLKIEEVVGCYSKDISYFTPTLELDAPRGRYFVFGNYIVNEKRKDGDTQAISDMTLFFPNDAYQSQFNQLNGYNPLYSSHGQFVEIQHDIESYYTKVVIMRPQLAIHPGIITGFVFAGILVVALLIGLLICWFRSKRRTDNVMPTEQLKNSMQQKSENQLKNIGPPPKEPMNILIQMKKLAQKCSNQQKCCICLTVGCDTYLPCLHFFHEKCIVDWFNRNDSCPLCQQKGQISDLIKFK